MNFTLNRVFLVYVCAAMSCPDSLEYAACRTGCLDQCERGLFHPGDVVAMGDGVIKANGSQCLTTPTEGCFCPEGLVLMGGKCVSEEACSQCVDHHGKTRKVLHTPKICKNSVYLS